MATEQVTIPENPLCKRLDKMLKQNKTALFVHPSEKPNERYMKIAQHSKNFVAEGKQCDYLHNGEVLQFHNTFPIPEKTMHEKHVCPYCKKVFSFLMY